MLTFLFVLQIIFWLLLIKHFIRGTKRPNDKLIFSAALILKIFAGCCVGWLYTYYYHGGDTLVYFHDAQLLTNVFKENPGTYLKAILGSYEVHDLQYQSQSRALFFAKTASFISIFSLQNYWLIAISLSMVNFFASWWLVMKIKTYYNIPKYVLFIPFLFYPSVVFWSAGLLKETIALALIYILCSIFLQAYKQGLSIRETIIALLASIVCAWLLWMLKYYYAAIFLPLLLSLLLFELLKIYTNILSKPLRGLLIFLPALILIFSAFMHFHPNLNPDLILKAIVRNHDLSVAASDEGEYVYYESLMPSLRSFVFYFPKALLSGLFRPLPGEGTTWFQWLAGFENLLILILSSFALSLIIIKRPKLHLSVLLFACMIYVGLLAGLIALASPNFGSLMRYKVAYAPFWLFLCLLVINSFQRTKRKSQSIKKI